MAWGDRSLCRVRNRFPGTVYIDDDCVDDEIVCASYKDADINWDLYSKVWVQYSGSLPDNYDVTGTMILWSMLADDDGDVIWKWRDDDNYQFTISCEDYADHEFYLMLYPCDMIGWVQLVFPWFDEHYMLENYQPDFSAMWEADLEAEKEAAGETDDLKISALKLKKERGAAAVRSGFLQKPEIERKREEWKKSIEGLPKRESRKVTEEEKIALRKEYDARHLATADSQLIA